MRSLKVVGALLSFLFLSLSVAAQQITIDLATLGDGETQKEPVSFVGTPRITVYVVNALPVTYRFSAEHAEVTQSRLPLNDFTRTLLLGKIVLPDDFKMGKDSCGDILKDVAAAVTTLTDEKEVPELRREILAKKYVAPCKIEAEQLITRLTTLAPREYSLRANETFTLSITRDGTDGPVVRTLLIPGESKGEWRLMYGFAYRLNRDEPYFTQAVEGEEKKFTIVRKETPSDVDRLEFEPTITYAWHKRGRESGWGFLAGVSVDITDPLVFGGMQWTWHDNIGAFAAIGVTQRTTLDGKYRERQIVGEALEGDALHEKAYAPTVLLGMSFRFDKNPFAKKLAVEKPVADKPQKPEQDDEEPQEEDGQ
jgi:hypothetical protein